MEDPTPQDLNIAYRPSNEEVNATNYVMADFIIGRNVINRQYNQFNNRNLFQAIDDWTMRYNGYLGPQWYFSDNAESQVFLNYTRNTVISFLSKIALQRPDVKITAVNKKTGVADKRFAQFLKDLNTYSLLEENGDARFLEAAFEMITKGTVIVYEGYAKNHQKTKVPQKFDAETGKITYKEENKIIFDNCFQKVVPLEDFYIANPYEPDVQKQPFIIWREITTYDEAKMSFGHYKPFQYVKPGSYTLTSNPTTFYRNRISTELSGYQVEILRYYCRTRNCHVLMINGVILYDGSIPFKDGMYPFAKAVFEQFDNNFFWGPALANKIMGEQDIMNTFWGMMIDKNKGSLLPYGLSSDLDDIIEDDVLRPNKIRKVSDINKWKFDSLPGVTGGEVQMLQEAMSFAKEFSGDVNGGANGYTANGGRLPVRQILLQQQQSQARMSYSLGFLENLERDRTKLRLNHLLQFTSIPKIEKITGLTGSEAQQLVYRDIKLSNVKLSDHSTGNKIIKLVNNDTTMNPDERQKMADNLSVMEAMGEETGVPTEALAVSVDTFYDYNFEIQVIPNSSYEKNQVLDQESRKEYANWRISMSQFGVPTDVSELVKWVDESYDIETDRFTPAQSAAPGMGMPPGMPPGMPGGSPPTVASPGGGSSAPPVPGEMKGLPNLGH